jgi:hypothetical protein
MHNHNLIYLRYHSLHACMKFFRVGNQRSTADRESTECVLATSAMIIKVDTGEGCTEWLPEHSTALSRRLVQKRQGRLAFCGCEVIALLTLQLPQYAGCIFLVMP